MFQQPIVEGHEECTKAVLKYMDELASHCDGFYNDEELATLNDMATMIAKYECFLHLFEEGCMNYKNIFRSLIFSMFMEFCMIELLEHSDAQPAE